MTLPVRALVLGALFGCSFSEARRLGASVHCFQATQVDLCECPVEIRAPYPDKILRTVYPKVNLRRQR